MDCQPRQLRKNGYVLVACLAVVVTTTILVLMFVSFSQETERTAMKRQYQDRGQEKIEMGMMALRNALEEQFQRNAEVETSVLSTDSGQINGSLEHGMYNLTMGAVSS
jgi:predicted PurR-regulated permease PerM